ncbi:tyrosine-type recombinase/integrase [Arthrobacter psychrolactophilus]
MYTSEQVGALMGKAMALDSAYVALTYQTLIGLLACSGLRVGEAIRANTVDFNDGVLSIIDTKFGKSRLVPLHPSAVEALAVYRRRVEQEFGLSLACEALFVSEAGTRLLYANVQHIFARLTAQAGITPRSSRCRPRPHDLRHSFATNTLHDAYLAGQNPMEILPILATYLGHVSPASTYWYLEATPDLLGAASGKLPSLPKILEGDGDDD